MLRGFDISTSAPPNYQIKTPPNSSSSSENDVLKINSQEALVI